MFLAHGVPKTTKLAVVERIGRSKPYRIRTGDSVAALKRTRMANTSHNVSDIYWHHSSVGLPEQVPLLPLG